jgi:tRNA-dihydrouridine synthase 2
LVFKIGPETIDKALIGCTRKVCPRTSTVIFTRTPSNGKKVDGTTVAAAETKESIIYRLHPARESKQLIFQIGTSKPELAVQAARLVAGDVAGIDVNAGCPKPFSTSGGMGAALLKTPDTLCAILEALVQQIGAEFHIGISVKIRLLATPAETEALVRRLVATGITGLTIHCRTTPMRPRERAIRDQLRMIAGVCREAGVACLMNGDVEDRQQALALAREYGVDGAMIATAAERNPSVFRPQADGGAAPWKEVVHTYLQDAMAVENRWGNTKFLLAQFVPAKEFAKLSSMNIGQCRHHEDVVKAMGFDELVDKARELDERLGLHDREVQKKGKRTVLNDGKQSGTHTSKKPKVEDVRVENDADVHELQGGTASAIAV